MSTIRAERVWIQTASEINQQSRSTAIQIPSNGLWDGTPIIRLGIQCTIPDQYALAEHALYRFSANVKWGSLSAWSSGGGAVIYRVINWLSDPTNEPGGMPGGAASMPASAKGQYVWLEIFTGAAVVDGQEFILPLAADVLFDDGA